MNKNLTMFIIFIFSALAIWLPAALSIPRLKLPILLGDWIVANILGLIGLYFLGLYFRDLLKKKRGGNKC